jgi:hypothetical protein
VHEDIPFGASLFASAIVDQRNGLEIQLDKAKGINTKARMQRIIYRGEKTNEGFLGSGQW